jgi:hypothetical protein
LSPNDQQSEHTTTTTVATGEHDFHNSRCRNCGLDSALWGGEWCPSETSTVTITADSALGLFLAKPDGAITWDVPIPWDPDEEAE